MCDRELDGSSSSLSSAELTLSSNAELGDVESASEPRVVIRHRHIMLTFCKFMLCSHASVLT